MSIYPLIFKIDKNKREIITDTDDDKILVRVWIDFNEDNTKIIKKNTKSSKTWSEIKNIKKLINNDEQLHHKVHAATVSGRRNHLKIVYPIS